MARPRSFCGAKNTLLVRIMRGTTCRRTQRYIALSRDEKRRRNVCRASAGDFNTVTLDRFGATMLLRSTAVAGNRPDSMQPLPLERSICFC
jgi:hypothetical protein